MIGRNYVKTWVGWVIVTGHLGIIVYIFLGKGDVWDIERKMSAALTIAPVTAAYFAAVVKSFVEHSGDRGPGDKVNLNYAAISFLVSGCLLLGVFYVVYSFPYEGFDKPERLQQALAGLEILLGGVVGFVVDSLFPRRTAK
jgi:hypothetical protein